MWKASWSDFAFGLAGWSDLPTWEGLAQIDMGRQDGCHVHQLKPVSLTEVFCWSHADVGWREVLPDREHVSVNCGQRKTVLLDLMRGDSKDDIECLSHISYQIAFIVQCL